ncbi:hypothetical protein AB3N60_06040 [Leptospira sp. WS39.C2]
MSEFYMTPRLSIFFIVLLLVVNCQNWGQYKRVDLTPQKIGTADIYVEGRSCKYFFQPIYPNLEVAVLDALSKAPGKKGLKNPEITDTTYMFSPIDRCTFVKGYATNEEPIEKPYK